MALFSSLRYSRTCEVESAPAPDHRIGAGRQRTLEPVIEQPRSRHRGGLLGDRHKPDCDRVARAMRWTGSIKASMRCGGSFPGA